MVLFLRSSGKGGEVLSAGSLDGGLIDGDNGAIGVGDEATVGSNAEGTSIDSVSSVVLSTGSLDSGLINGDNGTIGVGNEASVGSIGDSGIGSSNVVVGSIRMSIAVVGVWVSVSSKVSSLSSLDLGGLDWCHSSVGVGDELSAGGSHASEENLKTKQEISATISYVE